GTEHSYLAFTQASARQLARAAVAPDEGVGFNHVGIVVADAGAVAGALAGAGYREGFRAEPHPHRKRIYFHDADDNEWEFVEYLAEDAALRNDYAS
ncbi:MAG: VOC family protein, partial [Planctomycetaceae bacterium]